MTVRRAVARLGNAAPSRWETPSVTAVLPHSHSIVPGGLLVMSKTQQLRRRPIYGLAVCAPGSKVLP